MVGRRKEEEEGDVFVELNHLMAVELMLLCILEGGKEEGREGGREEGRKEERKGGREGRRMNKLGSQVIPLHTTLKIEQTSRAL